MSFTVALDTSALLAGFKEHAQRGIGRYVYELNRFFQRIKCEEVSIAPFNHDQLFAQGIFGQILKVLPAGRMTIRQQLFFPIKLKTNGLSVCDYVHFPAHMDAPSWKTKPYVLTVLDLIPLVLQDLYKSGQAAWRYEIARWFERHAIKNASLIIAISENTKNDLHHILGVPLERIVVTPLGVDQRFFESALSPEQEQALRASYGIPRDSQVILYVGGIDQRKNMRGLLRTFSGIVNHYHERAKRPPVLMIAGQISQDRQYPMLLALIKERGLENLVLLPGFVPDQDLLQLYALSSVFFFPSLYEGFGLPPLEAMASGTPVVSSNTSSLPEVLGDAAILVDPNDAQMCVKEICEVLENRELSSRLREMGRAQARKFTWDRTGQATLDAYKMLKNIR